MEAAPGIQTVLRLTLADGNDGKYPRVFVYNPADGLDDTVDLDHVANGMYSGLWTPPSSVVGAYTGVFVVYQNTGRTVVANRYDRIQETINVHDRNRLLGIIKGLLHDNGVLDQEVYGHTFEGQKYLTSARLRTYDTKANAQAAGATGLIDTYTLTGTYSDDEQVSWEVVREGS